MLSRGALVKRKPAMFGHNPLPAGVGVVREWITYNEGTEREVTLVDIAWLIDLTLDVRAFLTQIEFIQ